MIKVLVADDNPIQRKLLSLTLSDDENIIVKGEAESGEEVLRIMEDGRFDVLVLDVSLPGKSGIEVLKELRATGKEIPVIIVSNYPREGFESAVQAIGAYGYIEKNDVPDKIIEAIRACVPQSITPLFVFWTIFFDLF